MGIELNKGDSINIEKSDGSIVNRLCVGVNWGSIETKGMLGGIKNIPVDLDASCISYNAEHKLIELVYYGKLNVPGIKHTGDDIFGDVDGDQGIDNEVLIIDTEKLSVETDQIVFVLNSFQKQTFKDLPYASIRLYEGTAKQVDNILATYDVVNDPKFSGSTSLVLGKMTRQKDGWSFKAIGEITDDSKLEDTAKTVKQNYL